MRQKKLAQRAASAALAACMMFTLSAPALAESTNALMQLSINSRSSIARLNEQNSIPEDAKTLNIADGDIEVSVSAEGVQTATQGGQTYTGVFVVTGTSTTSKLVIKGSSGTAAKVYLNDLHITVSSGAAVSVSNNVDLYIEGSSVLQSGENCAGIQKEDDGQLTIDGSGSLEATGGESGAGIGGASGKPGNNITINGGTITASGKAGNGWGAGIGGGKGQGGSNITIRGGNVKAIPGAEAAGIGGGFKGNGTNISIEGGTVRAESGGGSGGTAAIGSGRVGGNGENIQITGGDITLKKAGADDVGIGGNGIEIPVAATFGGSLTYLDADGNKDTTKTNIEKYGPVVNGKAVNSVNYADILGNGALSYDKDTKTLSLNKSYTDVDSYMGNLTIYAPKTTVDLNGGEFSVLQGGKLVIEAAEDVTLTSAEARAIVGDANITCAGKLRITCENIAVNGNLTVNNASSVELIGKNNNGGTVTGAAVFNNTDEVTIQNKDATKGAAGSISYNGKDYVYFTTADGGALTDPRITPITADANYLRIVPSKLHSIAVPEGCSYKVENRDDLTTAHEGQTVTVTASADANRRFKGWKVTDGDVKLDNASQSTTFFVMKDKDVTLEASYADLYDITVQNGTASAAKAEVNETVDVQAVKPAAKGDEEKVFSGWKVLPKTDKRPGAGEFKNADQEATTFTLTEAGKVTLKAMYMTPREITADPDTVTLTKTDGQPVMTNYFAGDTVQAVAETVQGKLFDHWDITFGGKAVTLADIGLKEADLKNSPIEFKVPASSVNLTAVYKESRGLTLENATIVSVVRNGKDVTGTTEFFAGDVITVAPDNSDTRYQFVRWDVEGIAKTDLTVDEKTNNATFTMPDTDVKIHARRNRLFTVSVDNGSVNKATGIPGTEVTATATVGEKQKFDHWEVTFADKDVKLADIGLKKTDLTNPEITFNIPKSNVSLKAVCKDMHTVTINGKEVRTEKVEGDSITINAAEAGVSLDKFERWKTNDLPLSEAELTNPSLTFTMPDSNVVLEIVEKETYQVTVNHGKANGAKTVDVKPGTEVTLTADTREGYVFVGWKVETENADGNPIVTVANAKNETTSFIMPHGAVVLTAEYEQLHTVTVNYKTDGGAETKHSEQKAIYGAKITVTAEDRKAENLAFDHWEVTVDGLTVENLLDNARAEEAHFDMRRGEVVATAVYKQLHIINVHDGHAEVNGQPAEKAKEGDTVTVVPDTKLHKRFKSWKDDKGNTSLDGSTGTTFVMPNDAVDLTAEYVELYALDVTYCTAYDADHNVVNEAAAGDKITVEADEAKPDQIFTGWTATGVELDEEQKTSTPITFDMPSGKVTLKANYSYVHDQKVTVKYGTEDDAETEKTIYTPGNPVEIEAKNRRSEDLVFDHWTVEQGTGVQLVDEKAESTSFIMPESKDEIVLVAHYEQLHKITINDGTATGDKLLEMADGKSVGAVKGAEITIEADVKDDQVFDSWTVEQGNVTLTDGTNVKTTFTMGEVEVEITANYKNLHKITVHGDTGDELLDYTKIIQNAKEGAKQEITANEIEGKRFDHWVVNSENLTLTDDTANPLVIDAMPDSDLDLTAKYVDLYALTVDNGTAYDKDNHIADEAAADDSITVEADKLTGLESFVGWKLKAGTIIEITIKGETVSVSTDADGYLVDADGNKITAETFTFTMPAGKVELQAVTSIPAYPMSFPVKILEGVAAGDTITTGGTVTVDGEPVQYTVKPGQTVKITAEAPDERVYPGMVFDYWEIKSNVEVILDNANSESTTFTMPKGYVILTPHWKSSAVVVNPDEPDPGFVVEPEAPAADGSGAVIGVAAAGAAIWGGYEITTRVILNDLLPEGAAIPTNRGQLAMLIWTQKGKPEPAAEPAFTDVSDTELAKAAQWCVEQGLLTAEDGKFEPDGRTPKWRVIQVWNQAFPKE